MLEIEDRLKVIEREVGTLQRQLKLSRGITFLVLLMAGVVIAGGANSQSPSNPEESISTRRVVITDPKGTPRIVLEASGETAREAAPTAIIKLLDANGKPTHSIVQFRDAAGYWAHCFGTDKEWVQMSSTRGHAGLSMFSRTIDRKVRRASLNVSEHANFTFSADNQYSSAEGLHLSLAGDIPSIQMSDTAGKKLLINTSGVSNIEENKRQPADGQSAK